MAIPFLNQIDMGSQKIVNLLNPTNPQDAATKAYVDAVGIGVSQTLNAGDGWMLSSDLGVAIMFGNGMQGNVQLTDGANANRVFCVKFTLNRVMKISQATINDAGSGLGRTYSFGIYDAGGNKLVDSGTFGSTVSGGASSNAFGAVTLNPGQYWFAWTNSVTLATAVQGLLFNGSGTGAKTPAFVNKLHTYYGHAANAATAGAMPATLGAITADLTFYTSGGIPFVLWEP